MYSAIMKKQKLSSILSPKWRIKEAAYVSGWKRELCKSGRCTFLKGRGEWKNSVLMKQLRKKHCRELWAEVKIRELYLLRNDRGLNGNLDSEAASLRELEASVGCKQQTHKGSIVEVRVGNTLGIESQRSQSDLFFYFRVAVLNHIRPRKFYLVIYGDIIVFY